MDITCTICSVGFKVKPSRKNAKYCSRKCRSIGMHGHRPYHFKGGKFIHKGYTYVLAKGHPKADRDGYVLEHRLVMEKHIGRFLLEGEIVHHKNHNRSDNYISNLQIFHGQREHMLEHKFWEGRKNLRKKL